MQRAPVAGTTLEVAKGPTGADDYFQWKGTVTGPVGGLPPSPVLCLSVCCV